MFMMNPGVWQLEAEFWLLLLVRHPGGDPGSVERYIESLLESLPTRVQLMLGGVSLPSPLLPIGPLEWGWGLRHSGCQAWSLSICLSIWSQPASCLGQHQAFQSSVPILPPPAPTPVVRLQSPGKRLCPAEGGRPACPHASHIDLPRENQ